MAFEGVTNLASVEAADAERKRRQQQAALELEHSGLKDELLGLKQAEAGSVYSQLDKLGPRVAVSPEVRQDAEENRFLDQNREKRFARRDLDLERRSSALATPGPTVAERVQTLSKPLGEFANEDPDVRATELKTDPRARIPRLDALIAEMQGAGGSQNVSRETPERDYYREEPNGTLSFTNRPEVASQPGYRRYNADSGMTKDLGAPGGGLTTLRGPSAPPDARDALLQALQGERAVAANQPLTERETMGTLAKVKPAYDVEAANIADPAAIEQKLLTDVGAGKLDPGVGQELLSRYAGVAKQATKNGEYDPRALQEMLQPSAMAGPPAPDKAAALLQAPSPLPQAEAQAAEVTQQALEPPQEAPGTTRSPEASASEGFFAGLGSAARRGTERLTGTAPSPETPESFPGPGGVVRAALPLAAGPAVAGLGVLGGAAAGLGVGVGSELLGQLLNGESFNSAAIGGAGAMGAAGGAVAPVVGRGFNAVASLAKRARPSAIPGVYGPNWTAGAPTRVLGGLTEEVPSAGNFPSLLDRARQAAAQEGSTAIPEGPVPYLRENLPALRGGEFTPGPTTEEPLDIETLIQELMRRRRPQLTGPAPEPNTLPALRGGGFVLR